MERVKALVEKLNQQLQEGASQEHLITTVQFLYAELAAQNQQKTNQAVAVVMPAAHIVHTNIVEVREEKKESQEQTPVTLEQIWMSDPLATIPTLVHQPPLPVTELNEALSNPVESLNEKLRIEQLELASKLQDGPIKDLKKAIGINERFQFIQELFKGDEAMYDRSIKTINSFENMAEAEFWMQRELKLKLGWSDEHPLVRQFDQLVRRRFSSK
jgi:hypothetical protein